MLLADFHSYFVTKNMMLAQTKKILMVDFGVRQKMTDLENTLLEIGVTVQMNVLTLLKNLKYQHV